MKDVNSLISATYKNVSQDVCRDRGHGFGLACDDNSSVRDWKNAFINWIDSLY